MQCLNISINSDIFNISLDTGLCDTVKCVSTAATDTDYLDLCAYDWLFNILVIELLLKANFHTSPYFYISIYQIKNKMQKSLCAEYAHK